MGTPFEDPIVAGSPGDLIRRSIRSRNFVTGVSGWSIDRDGNAEFNNLTIHGILESINYVLNTSGWKLDTATGSAEFNDITARGTIIVGPSGLSQVVIDTFGGTFGAVELPTNVVHENQAARVGADALSRGGAAEQIKAYFVGPEVSGNTGYMTVEIRSGANDGSANELFTVMHSSVLGEIFTVNSDGTVVINGVDITPTAWANYTPTITGGGTATFTNRLGYWKRIANKTVMYTAYIEVNAAGSGTSPVQYTLPTAPYRGPTANIRQIAGIMHADNGTTATRINGEALIAAGGTGTTVDRLRLGDGTDLNGSQLTAGSSLTISGQYREA